jgi:hypothetical protein
MIVPWVLNVPGYGPSAKPWISNWNVDSFVG